MFSMLTYFLEVPGKSEHICLMHKLILKDHTLCRCSHCSHCSQHCMLLNWSVNFKFLIEPVGDIIYCQIRVKPKRATLPDMYVCMYKWMHSCMSVICICIYMSVITIPFLIQPCIQPLPPGIHMYSKGMSKSTHTN